MRLNSVGLCVDKFGVPIRTLQRCRPFVGYTAGWQQYRVCDLQTNDFLQICEPPSDAWELIAGFVTGGWFKRQATASRHPINCTVAAQ